MELRDLRYFVVVAEHLNLSRAAEALDLSATALGKSLRRLEESVGAKLVQRTSKGVALTAVGDALLDRIGPLQGMMNDVRHQAADLAQGRSGQIKAGVNPGTNEHRLAYAFAALARESPDVSLMATAGLNDILGKKLLKGELDLCIASAQWLSSPAFVFEHLYDVPFVVCASAHHRLAKRKQVSLADISGERWAAARGTLVSQMQTLFRAFESNGLPRPSMSLEADSSSTVRDIVVAYSDHLCVMNKELLRHEMKRYPLIELPVKEFSYVTTMSIVYRKGAYLSPAALRLIAILKDQARETAREAKRPSASTR